MTDEPRRIDFADLAGRIAGRAEGVPFTPEPDIVEVPWAFAWDARRPGQIPRKFLDAELADFRHEEAATRETLNGWAVKPDGRNLLVGGPVGVGKSRAAVAACRRSHFTRHLAVEFWPVVELLDSLRPGGPADMLDHVMRVPLLILDDLGVERPTDWTAERLYALVNRRWLEELPIVGTTNLPLTRKSAAAGYDGPTLDDVLGDRMFSRLVGGAALVRLSGPDLRRVKK